MIGLQVLGLTEFHKNKLKMENDEFFKGISGDVGEIAKEKAKQLCPVDEGELIASIFLDKTKDGFILGATARHAIFNEFGCYNLKMGPAKYKGQRPFLRPAIHFAHVRAQDLFNKKVNKAMG